MNSLLSSIMSEANNMKPCINPLQQLQELIKNYNQQVIKTSNNQSQQKMDLLQGYMRKHHSHMISVFKQMSKQDRLQATKVFSYIQNSFDLEQFRFQLNGKDFFSEEESQPAMQKLLESYYRMTQDDNSKKFYLYRIQFTFEQIGDILQYWLQKQPNLKIVYIQDGVLGEVIRGTIKVNKDLVNQNEQANKIENGKLAKNYSMISQQNNQFDIDQSKIPEIIAQYQESVKSYEQKLMETQSEQQKKLIKQNIDELNLKIKLLQQRIKASSMKLKLVQKQNTNSSKSKQQNKKQTVKTSDSPKSTNKKVTINYKAIFDFYAKQTHLTGVKATFQRIQHESQTINYQKLVHFLRQFNMFPENVPDRKKVHNCYIKNCSSTRDLNFEGFMNVLQGVVNILHKNKTKQQIHQFIKQKILQKNTKNGKILNHPFHSLEKQDFRINVNELNYNFKIKPQDGKFVDQVNQSIQKRKKDKQQAKTQRSKQKQKSNLRYLKKLQSIDPYNPLVVKNSKLLEQKPKMYQPIASLQNIQQYRDNSFNFQNYFGLDLSHQQPVMLQQNSKRNSTSKNYEVQSYRRGQQTQRKVEKIQKQQATRMKSLMSGIIQRTNAKMQKLGISPTKLQKSIKFN